MFKNRKIRKLDKEIIEKRLIKKQFEELRTASEGPEVNRIMAERYLNEAIERLNKQIDALSEQRYELLA